MQEISFSTILALIVAVAVVAAGAWAYWRMQRRRALARKYGSEYQRIVQDKGDPQRELEAREKRVSGFELKDLEPAQRERYMDAWARIQADFVDEPARAARKAHELLMAVMSDRGYPEAELEQRQRDLSVNYPDLIEPYREACEIARRQTGPGGATTGDLRKATICYRSLLNALLNGRSTARLEEEKHALAS